MGSLQANHCRTFQELNRFIADAFVARDGSLGLSVGGHENLKDTICSVKISNDHLALAVALCSASAAEANMYFMTGLASGIIIASTNQLVGCLY